MLKVLRVEKLYINQHKCSFMKPSAKFLGFIISSQGVEADPAKVQAVQNWLTLKIFLKSEASTIWPRSISDLFAISAL